MAKETKIFKVDGANQKDKIKTEMLIFRVEHIADALELFFGAFENMQNGEGASVEILESDLLLLADYAHITAKDMREHHKLI